MISGFRKTKHYKNLLRIVGGDTVQRNLYVHIQPSLFNINSGKNCGINFKKYEIIAKIFLENFRKKVYKNYEKSCVWKLWNNRGKKLATYSENFGKNVTKFVEKIVKNLWKKFSEKIVEIRIESLIQNSQTCRTVHSNGPIRSLWL